MAESLVALPMATPSTPERRWRSLSIPGKTEWPAATVFVVVILILYVFKQMFSVAAFYPFSGHDELAHYSYVRTLATEHRVPVLPDLATWREGLNGGQPPPTDNLPDELYPFCRFALDWFCAPTTPAGGPIRRASSPCPVWVTFLPDINTPPIILPCITRP